MAENNLGFEPWKCCFSRAIRKHIKPCVTHTHALMYVCCYDLFALLSQDKLNGKRLDSAIWEMGNLVIGSLVGKLCRMKLCGLEVRPHLLHYLILFPPLTTSEHIGTWADVASITALLFSVVSTLILQEVGLGMETILQRLHSTKEDSERVIYMLSLKNALLPETIPTLLHYAEEGSPSVSVAAISALQRFSSQHISSEVWDHLVYLCIILGGLRI